MISNKFRRKTQTQSCVQVHSLDRDSKWKSGSSIKKEPRLRSPHTRRRIRKNLHPRSSEARRESFCPLDKDLSWKSGYRTSLTNVGPVAKFPQCAIPPSRIDAAKGLAYTCFLTCRVNLTCLASSKRFAWILPTGGRC